MKLKDRISGNVVDRVSDPVLLGQWLLERVNGIGLHNGCPVEDGDVLVPDPIGRWTILGPDNTSAATGRFAPDALPGEQDFNALLQLGRLLRNPARADAGWLEWCATSPLASGLDKAVKEHPLEDKIDNDLHYLGEVCRKPRTHIRLETERVLVSRARRIDARAPMWLAAHTEDWEHRRIFGVQPKRVLAHVREEEWNLYENRVAARLIDNLVAWLRRRIAEVRRVLDDIFVRLADYRVSTEGSRHRLNRIFNLWGEAWEASHGREVAQQTLRKLERLLYRVLGLMDSPLYRRVPRAAQVPRALRMTNLLSNDANYRGVARLWHHWSSLAAPQTLSPSQLYRRHQEGQRGFDAWCMLVLVRACSQLGLFPIDEDVETAITPGCLIRLTSGHHVAWLRDGTLQVTDGADVVVRFVPLLHVIERPQERAAVEARTGSIVRDAAGNTAWTVILHPAVPGGSKHVDLMSVGDPPAPRTTGAVDFVRVSPFSLESVERVARAVRWATMAPRMLAYPPVVKMPPRELADTVGSWLQARGPAMWMLVRIPRPEERTRLALEQHIAVAHSKRDELAAERQAVENELRRVRGVRREMAELNRRKRELLIPLQEAQELVMRLEEFSNDLARAEREIAALIPCPVCHAPAEFFPRADNCFAARCSSDGCETTWELRSHALSDGRIPILLPGGVRVARWPRAAPPQWVDEILGCDVLAVPAVDEGGVVVFHPPRTTATGKSGASVGDV